MNSFGSILCLRVLFAAPALSSNTGGEKPSDIVHQLLLSTTETPIVRTEIPAASYDTAASGTGGRIVGAAYNFVQEVRQNYNGLKEAYATGGIMGIRRVLVGFDASARYALLNADSKVFSPEEAKSIREMVRSTQFELLNNV